MKDRANKRAALDAAFAFDVFVGRQQRGASEHQR